MSDSADEHAHDHDHGLRHDLMQISRRRALGLLGAAGVTTALAGCDGPFFERAEADVIGTGANGAECVAHPPETAGPFPADGSNSAHGTLANVLDKSGIVRADMRTNLDPQQPAAEGAPIELTVEIVDVANRCRPLEGYAIYLWHCDAAGRYSIYDLPETSYLRAVGVTDANGAVTFTSIFPGCYRGRFPHIHFEIYPSLEKATSYENRILTSQLAMPEKLCGEVYAASDVYRESVPNYEGIPLAKDGIFANNTPRQLAAQTPVMEADGAGGYRGKVVIGLKSSAG
ncbi:hypothetical protein [Hyphomicrobium sp. D-2]|uniref:dioxygenase family protein n=1 Tax=Hyphomicrobium sp. D-2 TaxID=3041621 RepID=UPI0024557F6B|nr:hypothetical protein [Hyphomicrobium sp. D-2]MDH4981568.1 hypothetical protein [Hyphomicrobium sp. D-2]